MIENPSATLRTLPADFRAIVIGASGGIGGALCDLLSREPGLGELITLSRSNDGFDLLDEATVADPASRLSGKPIHLLVCATGALTLNGHSPEKSLRQLDPEVMATQFRINAIGPALVLKHLLPLLDREDRTVAVFLSARVSSIGDNRLGRWISYRSAKAALNQIVRTASIELARTHSRAVVSALHPGTVRTSLSAAYSTGHRSVSAEEAASSILQTIDGLQTTGSFIAYDGSNIEVT